MKIPSSWFVLFLLTIVLFDLLLFMASDYTSGIFKLYLSFWFWPLHCLYFDLQILIIPVVSSSYSCPFFWPLYFLSSFDIRLLNSDLESSNVTYWTTSKDIQCKRHKWFSNILIVRRTTYYITSPVLFSKDKRWCVIHSTYCWLILISVLLKCFNLA